MKLQDFAAGFFSKICIFLGKTDLFIINILDNELKENLSYSLL